MWILSKFGDREVHYYLFCGTVLKVGRTGNAYISLPGDKSISKNHALFSLDHKEQSLGYPEQLPRITLVDTESSNGTFIKSENGDFTKLPPNHPLHLKTGSTIRFGRESFWRLKYNPLIVITSMVEKETKLRMKEYMQTLGGHLVKDWQKECCYLVMEDLKLSTKTVAALAAGVHITTPSYFKDFINAIKDKLSLPNPKNYLPPLKEVSIISTEVSFLPDPERKVLFSGKNFWFQNEASLKRMKDSIEGAGGAYGLLSAENFSKVVLDSNILVKPHEREQLTTPIFIQKALDLMAVNELSTVPESDIGLAITYKSILRYCNPRFRVNGILQRRDRNEDQSQNLRILATETQEGNEAAPSIPLSRTTIPESGESSKGKLGSSLPKELGTSSGPGAKVREGTFAPSKKTAAKNTAEFNPVPLIDARTLKNTTLRNECTTPELEDKENCRKRKRSGHSELTSPHSKKLSNHGYVSHENTLLSETEVIDLTQDEVDDCSTSFNPIHVSTQKEIEAQNPRTATLKTNDGFVIPSPVGPPRTKQKNVRVAPSRCETTKDHCCQTSSPPKSIPFDPYTLPSIPADHFGSSIDTTRSSVEATDEETHIFSGAVIPMKEPQNQSFESIDTNDPQLHKKISLVSEDPMPCVNETLSGTTRRETPEKLPNVALKNHNNTDPKKEEFSLSFTSRRRKRNRGDSDSTSTDGISEGLKYIKLEKEHTTGLDLAGDQINKGPQQVKRSASEQEQAIRKMQPLTDEEDNDKPFISKGIALKQEKLNEETQGLVATKDKTFVVVEVVNLVMQKENLPLSRTKYNGVPNFKRFRKILPASFVGNGVVLSLPRIIGGNDLVCHSASDDRRNTFLASQPQLQEDFLLRKEGSQQKLNAVETSFFEDNFDTRRPTQRRKGRL